MVLLVTLSTVNRVSIVFGEYRSGIVVTTGKLLDVVTS